MLEDQGENATHYVFAMRPVIIDGSDSVDPFETCIPTTSLSLSCYICYIYKSEQSDEMSCKIRITGPSAVYCLG